VTPVPTLAHSTGLVPDELPDQATIQLPGNPNPIGLTLQ
jgi:hypothetical protein